MQYFEFINYIISEYREAEDEISLKDLVMANIEKLDKQYLKDMRKDKGYVDNLVAEIRNFERSR